MSDKGAHAEQPDQLGRIADMLERQVSRQEHEDRRAQPFVLEGAVIRVTSSTYTAVGTMAGQQFRGNPKYSRGEAMRDLFLQLSQEQNQDAVLALDMAAEGTRIDEVNEEVAEAMRALRSNGGAHRALDAGPLPRNAGGDQVAL